MPFTSTAGSIEAAICFKIATNPFSAHHLPGRYLSSGTGPVHPFKPPPRKDCAGYEGAGRIPISWILMGKVEMKWQEKNPTCFTEVTKLFFFGPGKAFFWS